MPPASSSQSESYADPPLDPKVLETAELLKRIVQALVDFPDQASLQVVAGEQTVIFEARVAAIDVKRLIGRRGRTADAIRELLVNLGGKARTRYLLEIIEPTHRVDEIPIPRGTDPDQY